MENDERIVLGFFWPSIWLWNHNKQFSTAYFATKEDLSTLKKHLSILVIMQENIVQDILAVGRFLASLIWCCVKSWTRPPPTSIFKGHPSPMPFIPVETPVLCYNLVSVCYYLYMDYFREKDLRWNNPTLHLLHGKEHKFLELLMQMVDNWLILHRWS